MIRLASTHLDRRRAQVDVAAEGLWESALSAANCHSDGDAAGEMEARARALNYDRELIVAVFRYLLALGAT
jgi:hypothetical protein